MVGTCKGAGTLHALEKHVVYQSKRNRAQLVGSGDPASSTPSESRYALIESRKVEEHHDKEQFGSSFRRNEHKLNVLITDRSKRKARGMSQQLKRSHREATRCLQSNDYNLVGTSTDNSDLAAPQGATRYILDQTNTE